MNEFAGRFPRQPGCLDDAVRGGRSTAAAIAAFARRRAAILDGNVKRVLTRCYGIEGWPGDKAIENQYGRWPSSSCRTRWRTWPPTPRGWDGFGQLAVRARPAALRRMPDGRRLRGARRAASARCHRPPAQGAALRSTVMLLARNAAGEVGCNAARTAAWGGLWSLPELADIGEAPSGWRRRAGQRRR